MIVLDEHELFFVHIPKCGGTSVRRKLTEISGQEDIYDKTKRQFDGIIPVRTPHPTLRTLCDHTPDLFEKLTRYQSFAAVRDPMERFPSAMYTRLRQFKKINLVAGQPFSMRDECAEVIEALNRHDGQMPRPFMHFQRQIDFVEMDGVQLVKHLYTLETLDALMGEMGRRMDVDNATIGRDNQSVRLKADKTHRIVRAFNEMARSVLPHRTYHRLRDAAVPIVAKRLNTPLTEAAVGHDQLDFLTRYYAADQALYDRVRSQISTRA